MAVIPPLPTIAPAPPAEKMYPCEFPGCTNVTPASQTYSYVGGCAMPGPGLAAFQCPGEQHFGCCPQHALDLHLACLTSHQVPMHNMLLQQNSISIDSTVLANAQAASQKLGTPAITGASVSLP